MIIFHKFLDITKGNLVCNYNTYECYIFVSFAMCIPEGSNYKNYLINRLDGLVLTMVAQT